MPRKKTPEPKLEEIKSKEKRDFNPFDVTIKSLVRKYPGDWLILMGVSEYEAELIDDEYLGLIDTDLTTVTTTSDKILKLNTPIPRYYHLEFESTGGPEAPERCLRYNVLVDYHYKTSADTTLFLLRKEADHPSITGEYEKLRNDGSLKTKYYYYVVRVWELPVEMLLNGNIGTLPLAPLSNVKEEDLPAVLTKMEERIVAEVPLADQTEFRTEVFLLLGLNLKPDVALKLMKGVVGMRESSTYQWILGQGEQIGTIKGKAEGIEVGKEEGMIEEAQNVLIELGGMFYGNPTLETIAKIEAITSYELLKSLRKGLLSAKNWEEFFTLTEENNQIEDMNN